MEHTNQHDNLEISTQPPPLEDDSIDSPINPPEEEVSPTLPVISETIPPEVEKVVAPVTSVVPKVKFTPERVEKKRVRKPMSIKARIFLILFTSFIGIIAISAIGQLFTLYEVSFQRDDGSIGIHLEPRFPDPPPRRQTPPSGTPGLSPQQDDWQSELPAPPVVIGDGTRLDLLPRPQTGLDGISPRLNFQEIYQQVSPSVVLIEVTLRSAFGIGIGSGTGVVLSEHGFILTSAHVIEDARSISVMLYNGLRFEAALVGMDEQIDIAVLKIDAEGLIPAAFGNSDLVQVGEEVAVIGNPLGQFHTMSNGIISAVNRDIVYDGVTMRMLQTNAAINEGNSGGPLINLYGQVIGIANLKLVSSDGSVEGMGFAIPTAIIEPVVNALLHFGEVPARPSIGIVVLTLDATEAMQRGLSPGVYVDSIAANAPALAQGLQEGDHIQKAAGLPIDTIFDLRAIIGRFGVGDDLNLTIQRDGEIFEIYVTLMDSDLVQH